MKKRNNILQVVAGGLSLLLAISALGHTQKVQASFVNEKNSNIIRSVQVQDRNIPESSLIIGSYIIHINGLSDEVLEQAEASANEFNQMNRYYKSELAGGKWFDVTHASSIADISTSGVSVETSVIENISFTHQVSADGVVTDLRYGLVVSAFDIKAPYCLWEMDELEQLEIQYQLLEDKKGKTDSDEIALISLQNFYGKTIRTENTDRYDNMISGLEKYKNELAGREKPAIWAEEVQKVMVHADALRRVEAYTNLSNNLDILLNDISGQTELTGNIEDYIIDNTLVDAISQSIQNVEQSILTYSAQILTDSDSATMKARLQYSNELMNAVSATADVTAYSNLPWYYKWYEIWIRVRASASANYNRQICDQATQKLVNLSNTSSGEVMDAQAEIETLQTLVQQASEAYKEKLAAGVTQAYKEAVLQNTTQAVMEKHLTEQKNQTDAARLEYQSILAALFERMGNAELQKYIEKLLNEIPDLKNCIPNDAVKVYQLETVEEHKNWLSKELTSAVMNASDSSEMDQLKAELEELEKEKRQALDQNNLVREKELAAEISAKKKQIEALEESLLNTVASSNSSEAQKARALAGLGQGNTASMLQNLANEIASAIRTGDDSDTVKNKIDAFQAMSSLDAQAAAMALTTIEDAMNAVKNNLQTDALGQALLKLCEDAVNDTKDLLKQDDSAQKENLKIEDLLKRIESAIGTSVEMATTQEGAAMVWALSRYAVDYHNSDAGNLAVSYAAEMYTSSNPYCYLKLENEIKEYVNLKQLGEVLGYRYIFKDAHSGVTLNKGSEYYSFTNNSTGYSYTDNKVGTLEGKAVNQETIYILSNDAKAIFNVSAGYISDSDYAILVTTQVEEAANKIYEELIQHEE